MRFVMTCLKLHKSFKTTLHISIFYTYFALQVTCSISCLLLLRWRRIGSIQTDMWSTAWPETTCRQGCHETESSSSSCGTSTGSWKTGDMGSNFGAGKVFLILMLKEIQGSSSVLPFVFEAQPNQSKLQILKIYLERTRPNRQTQHLDLRIHSPKNPVSFHCIPTLYSPQKNQKVSGVFQGIAPGPSCPSHRHRFIMAPCYRPISSITESLTLENTGPLEATGPPPDHDMSCFVFFFVGRYRDTLNRARALFGWLVFLKCHWDFAAFWDPKFLQISIWQGALISHQRLDVVQGVGFATTNSKPGAQTPNLESKNLLSGSALLCRQRGSCHMCFQRISDSCSLCVGHISGPFLSRSWVSRCKGTEWFGDMADPSCVLKWFQGLERGWFLCNVGIGFLWKRLGSRQNSSAGYSHSLVFSWIKWKSPSLKTLFHRMSVKPMSPGPVSLQHRYWRRWYTSWWNARDFGGFRSGLQGGDLQAFLLEEDHSRKKSAVQRQLFYFWSDASKLV